METMNGQTIRDLEHVQQFILAGRAVFTLRSIKTGGRFTFRVRGTRSGWTRPNGPTHFVDVLTGPDNENHYSYLGYIQNEVFKYGVGKSIVSGDAPSVMA